MTTRDRSEQVRVSDSQKAADSATVCVVVPIHREPLLRFEEAALKRCLTTLAPHPIAVVKPHDLKLHVDTAGAHVSFESFPREFFRGIDGYNRLLLSDEFYARFEQFEFILIHQLDAFVFDDRLLDWCARDYDYIGAPWIAEPMLPSWHQEAARMVRRRVYRWINRQARREPGMHYTQYAYCVGNGGFSLRKVATMRAVLAELSHRAERYRQGPAHIHHEDLFFCVEANRYRDRVRIPSWREAVEFAWELEPNVAAQATGGKLPFGCHAWNKLHRDAWRPIFARIGMEIDALLDYDELPD